MKKTRKLISICIVLAMVLCFGFAGCDNGDGGKTATPEKATGLNFNFETGEFSFSDVKAEEYKVRVFPAELQEGEADMPITQHAVRDSDKASYTGTLDVSGLTPGRQYKAVVYSFVENEDGTLSEAISDAVLGVYKATYKTPTNVQGVSCTILENTITVTLSGDFFSGDYVECAPSFQIKLFKDGELMETKVLTDDEIDVVTSTTTNSSGQEETVTEGQAEASFTVADPAASYTVTLKIISTDANAYYDSAEGDPYAVTEYVEAPEGGDQGGNQGNTGEGDSEDGENSEDGEQGGAPAESTPSESTPATEGSDSGEGEGTES